MLKTTNKPLKSVHYSDFTIVNRDLEIIVHIVKHSHCLMPPNSLCVVHVLLFLTQLYCVYCTAVFMTQLGVCNAAIDMLMRVT